MADEKSRSFEAYKRAFLSVLAAKEAATTASVEKPRELNAKIMVAATYCSTLVLVAVRARDSGAIDKRSFSGVLKFVMSTREELDSLRAVAKIAIEHPEIAEQFQSIRAKLLPEILAEAIG